MKLAYNVEKLYEKKKKRVPGLYLKVTHQHPTGHNHTSLSHSLPEYAIFRSPMLSTIQRKVPS